MVTSINLGSFGTIGGRTVATGVLSGLDSEKLITTAVDAKKIPVTKLEDKVTLNSKKADALAELRSTLQTFQAAADALRNPVGLNSSALNSFEARSGTVTADDGVEGSTYLNVTADAGATVGGFSAKVVSLATTQNSRSTSFASKTTDLGLGATSFDITVGATATTINLVAGDTLENLASRINAKTGATGVVANIIQVSTTDFRLSLSSQETGTENAFTFDFTADANVGTTLNFGAAIQTATDAQLNIDGVVATRSSNTIDDVIDGLTFTLKKVTPTAPVTTLTVNISEDTAIAKNAILDFVDAYNNFAVFASEQQARNTDGSFTEDAILGSDPTLKTAISRINTQLTAIVNGLTDGDPSKLSDIGITFSDFEGDDEIPATRNIMKVNDLTLENYLSTNFDAVRNLFEFNLTSDSGKVSAYERDNNITISEFTLDVDITRDPDEIAKATYVDEDGVTQTIDLVYEAIVDRAVSNDITATAIFGASTTSSAFTGLVDGDQFRITVTDATGAATNHDFTYRGTPAAANEFSSLTTLATAISAATGITASISSNKLSISADDDYSTLTFTNLTATDFKGELGVEDTEILGGTITMPDDSVLGGLKLIYSGQGFDTTDVTMSQGIADLLYNAITDFITEDTGMIDIAVDALDENSSDLNDDIAKLNDQIEQFRETLLKRYSALEEAIARVNSILQLLDAQSKAQQANS